MERLKNKSSGMSRFSAILYKDMPVVTNRGGKCRAVDRKILRDLRGGSRMAGSPEPGPFLGELGRKIVLFI